MCSSMYCSDGPTIVSVSVTIVGFEPGTTEPKVLVKYSKHVNVI